MKMLSEELSRRLLAMISLLFFVWPNRSSEMFCVYCLCSKRLASNSCCGVSSFGCPYVEGRTTRLFGCDLLLRCMIQHIIDDSPCS